MNTRRLAHYFGTEGFNVPRMGGKGVTAAARGRTVMGWKSRGFGKERGTKPSSSSKKTTYYYKNIRGRG